MTVEGPYFDDLEIGDVFDSSPALTLTPGDATLHRAILGTRLRLTLDERLSRETTGAALADPSLVWDVAIGQSTLATQRVIANLFYRGLAFHRIPAIGDTLTTRTEVVGLRQTRSRPSGLAALRILTTDQDGRVVLDFWRCAMLPLSAPTVATNHDDDLSGIGAEPDLDPLAHVVESWRLDRFPRSEISGQGTRWELETGDVVTSAPELARMTLNIAHVHHDRFSTSDGRLVYGGHTIGVALAQLSRAVPDIVTVAGWHGCDHVGPVREGDTLISTIEVDSMTPYAHGLHRLDLRVRVRVRGEEHSVEVLDWRPIILVR